MYRLHNLFFFRANTDTEKRECIVFYLIYDLDGGAVSTHEGTLCSGCVRSCKVAQVAAPTLSAQVPSQLKQKTPVDFPFLKHNKHN